MKRSKLLCSALLLLVVAVVSVPAANAVTVKVLAAGSSAMWQLTALAAYNNLAGANAHHYTIGGNCESGTTLCAYIDDSQRSSNIANEGGNLWIVWDDAQANVWAYLTVDSVVGVRSFMASPRTLLQIDLDALTTAGQNRISTALWGSDETSLPSAIYNALSGATFTAGATDIRPEDAYYASCRAMSALNTTTYEGLGYGSGCNGATLVGTTINSAFTSATANPVEFVLDGNQDPFPPFNTVPASTTVPVGAVPVLFLINKTNTSNLGATFGGSPVFNNVAHADALKLFSGDQCDGNAFNAPNSPPNFNVHVMLREPLSGTMNTTEFTTFRLTPTQSPDSKTQEKNVGDPSSPPNPNNPLNKSCAIGGDRKRGIGTGEIVNTAVKNTADSIGYAFFSYGNVSQLAGTLNYGYLKLDGVDGLNSTYTDGQLPTCTAPSFCPATPGTTYPHLRDGTYRAWSVVRFVTDASGPNLTNIQDLVTQAQNHVNDKVPDFVPFVGSGSEPGLTYYRSHFTQAGIAPNNGLGGGTEAGGDMGGCIHPRATTNVLEERQDEGSPNTIPPYQGCSTP